MMIRQNLHVSHILTWNKEKHEDYHIQELLNIDKSIKWLKYVYSVKGWIFENKPQSLRGLKCMH